MVRSEDITVEGMSSFMGPCGGDTGGIYQTVKKKMLMDFPGGPVVKNLPCTAGDMGSIPDGGTGILQAMEPLSLSTEPPEPIRHN